MTLVPSGVIDCDVHVEPASIDVVKKYLSSYWVEYLRGAGRVALSSAGLYPPKVPISATAEARASGTFPPQTYEQLQVQLLDQRSPEFVILNCIATFLAGRNPYYEAAIARAVNEWVRDEWLDRDDRLRASIVVPALNPDAAAEEIERLAPDPRFVQVLLPVRSETHGETSAGSASTRPPPPRGDRWRFTPGATSVRRRRRWATATPFTRTTCRSPRSPLQRR